MLFINDSQVAYLEDVMWEKGYLDTRQMAQAFQMLRSNDLIWSQGLRQYMLGERSKLTDLMAWNADATRMPYRMHSEYLRRLFLQQRPGRRTLSCERKARGPFRHSRSRSSPWAPRPTTWRRGAPYTRSCCSPTTDATFLLTTGGHNVGILGLGERRFGQASRTYRVSRRTPDSRYVDPETWLTSAERCEGSWWPAWVGLADRTVGQAEAAVPPWARRTKAIRRWRPPPAGMCSSVDRRANQSTAAKRNAAMFEFLTHASEHRYPNRRQPVHCADIMTSPVLTVGPDTSVREIAALLAQNGISAVPVVDSLGSADRHGQRRRPHRPR